MTKYKITPTTKYKKDIKVLIKRGDDLSLLIEVVAMLANGETLPAKYCDHQLRGHWKGYRDCHIKDDWVLVYKIDKDVLTLVLSRTGTYLDVLN